MKSSGVLEPAVRAYLQGDDSTPRSAAVASGSDPSRMLDLRAVRSAYRSARVGCRLAVVWGKQPQYASS